MKRGLSYFTVRLYKLGEEVEPPRLVKIRSLVALEKGNAKGAEYDPE
jgi:hypothetical protein